MRGCSSSALLSVTGHICMRAMDSWVHACFCVFGGGEIRADI